MDYSKLPVDTINIILNFIDNEHIININEASANGNLKILNWCKINNIHLKYSDYAMNWASKNGHINILDW